MARPTTKIQHLNTGEPADANSPVKSLAEKLLSIMSEMQNVEKTGTLPGNMGGKKYFSYDDIADRLRVLCKIHGVLMLPSSVGAFDAASGVATVLMTYHIVNIDDVSDTYTCTMQGMGSEGRTDKGMYLGTAMKKAITSATRYMWKELFLVNDGTDDEPQEEKQTQQAKQNGNGATATAEKKAPVINRPNNPDTLLQSFNKMRTKQPQPASDEMTGKAVKAIGALCATPAEKDVLKSFLGIFDKSHITEGVAVWLLAWINPQYADDGMVSVNEYTLQEMKLITDYMEEMKQKQTANEAI